MHSIIRRVAFFILVALLALTTRRPAQAETFVWNFDSPFAAGSVVDLDLGATMMDITSVTIAVDGIGGEQRYLCMTYGNPTGHVPLDLHLEFDRDAGSGAAAASTVVFPPILSPFTRTGTVTAAGGWGFLEDGRFTLTARYEPESFPSGPWTCYGIDFTSPVVNHLTLTIICSVAVPTEPSAWGAVKALYR